MDKDYNLRVTDMFLDDENELYWCFCEQHDRCCYKSIPFDMAYLTFENSSKKHYADMMKRNMLRAEGYFSADEHDILDLPRIEDATKAMQKVYYEVMESDYCVCYVDNTPEQQWPLMWRMEKEEFERQMDSDIKRYDLSKILLKNIDEVTLYFACSDLQSAFSAPLVKFRNRGGNEE